MTALSRQLPFLRGQDGCFVPAKTEIAVFGPGQATEHVAGKDFALFLPEHVLLNCAPKVEQKKTGL